MLEELIEAVEMMDGRSLHQTDHARSKPWRCCYVPVISFRVFRVGTQGPLQAQVSRAGVLVTKRYSRVYCISVAAVGVRVRRVGKLTQQWCPRESGKRKRRGHDTRRRRAGTRRIRSIKFWEQETAAWAHFRLHGGAEAILRADRVAEITGNGPCTAKFLARILHDALRLRSEPSYLWRPLPVENPSTRDV